MSYILDALKKAEEERSRRVSPLRTGGAEPRPRRRWIPWLVAGTSLALLPAIGWLALRAPAPPRPAGDSPTPAVRIQPPRPEAAATPDAPARSVSPPREPVRLAPARRLEPPALPPTLPRRKLASPPATPAESAAPPPPAPDPPRAVATAPPPAAPEPPRAAPPPAADSPPSALDAMAKLSLTILVHTADARDRLVYIDGKRYAEGDRVDGRYLVEAIQPDGVRLSFEGERFFLRAGLGSSAR